MNPSKKTPAFARESLSQKAYVIGMSVLCAHLFLVLGAGLAFLIGGTFSWWWWVLYAVGAGVGIWFPGRVRRISLLALYLMIHGLILIGATALASGRIDVGWDSVETHQEGIILVREGWNPVVPQPGWLESQPVEGIVRSEPSFNPSWFYYNGMYAGAALFADLPFGFEGAKGYRLLLLLALFLLSISILRNAGVPWMVGMVGAALLALNPIGLYQIWTLYMDLDVAVYSSLVVVGLFGLSFRWNRETVWVVIASLLLLALAKRSGPAYAMVFLGVFILGYALRKGNRGAFLRLCGMGTLGLLGIAVLVGLLGATGNSAGGLGRLLPYAGDFVQKAVLQPDAFDRSMDIKVPDTVAGLPRPIQFARSLLEESRMNRGAPLKPPMTWQGGEWDTFKTIIFPGFESGGFGPLFSGLLFLGILARLFASGKPALPGSAQRWILYGAMIFICFVVPSWWARWVPFLWVLPLLLSLEVILGWHHSSEPVSRWLLRPGRSCFLPVLLAAGCFAVAFVNAAGVGKVSLAENGRATEQLTQLLESLQATDQPVVVDFDRSLLVKRWFRERDIDYVFGPTDGLVPSTIPYTYARIYSKPDPVFE